MIASSRQSGSVRSGETGSSSPRPGQRSPPRSVLPRTAKRLIMCNSNWNRKGEPLRTWEWFASKRAGSSAEGGGRTDMGERRHRAERMENRYCLSRTRLPTHLYVVREKYLKRFRTLARQLTDVPVAPGTEFEGLVNVGEGEDEIWVEKGLSEAEKRFVVIHELVHARRQEAGEDFDNYAREERIVELEAVARAPRTLLRDMPSGLALVALHDFLTSRGRLAPNTSGGLIAIHRRICQVLGVDTTLACGMPPEAHRRRSTRPRAGKD